MPVIVILAVFPLVAGVVIMEHAAGGSLSGTLYEKVTAETASSGVRTKLGNVPCHFVGRASVSFLITIVTHCFPCRQMLQKDLVV